MKVKVMTWLALLLITAAPAFGEKVTLREAIGRAIERNQLVKASAFEKGAAEQGAAASRSRYLPRVFLESGAVLSNTPSTVFMMKLDEGRIDPGSDFAADKLNDPSARGDFKSAVTFEQPLIDFGIGTGVDLAARQAEAAGYALEQRREEVAFRVFLSYLGVRRAQAYLAVAEQAVANAKEHDRLATLKERDGIGLKSDRLRTATALAEAEQRLLTARNDLTLARMRLNLVTGGPQGEALDIEELPTLLEPALPQGEQVKVATRSRPDLKVVENSVRMGELGVRQAKDAYLPTLYARGGYQVNDRDLPLGMDKDSWNLGVNLRWELFDGRRRSHERERAELAQKSSQALLEDRRREVALEVAESLLRRDEAGLKLESARAAVRDAEEGTRLVRLRFGNGLSPLVELMDAEDALNRSRANLVEVENSFIAATGEVHFRSGVFVKEVVK